MARISLTILMVFLVSHFEDTIGLPSPLRFESENESIQEKLLQNVNDSYEHRLRLESVLSNLFQELLYNRPDPMKLKRYSDASSSEQDEYIPVNLKPYGRMVMAKKQQAPVSVPPKAGNLQKSHHLRML